MDFYLSVMCQNCDEEILSLCRTYMDEKGIPVISVDMGTQQSYYCEACEHTTYAGDLDLADEDDL